MREDNARVPEVADGEAAGRPQVANARVDRLLDDCEGELAESIRSVEEALQRLSSLRQEMASAPQAAGAEAGRATEMTRDRQIREATTISEAANGRASRTIVIRERRTDEDIVFMLVTRTDDDQRPGPVPEIPIAARGLCASSALA